MSIDFNDLRLVRKYRNWQGVMLRFFSFIVTRLDDYSSPEAAWAAFLKQEDEDGEA